MLPGTARASRGASSKRAALELEDGDEVTKAPTRDCANLETFRTVADEGSLVGANLGESLKDSMRGCTGEESGDGEREGNEVRLLSEGATEGFKEVLEACFRGLTRTVLDLRLEEREVCEEVRRSSASWKLSITSGA